MSRRGWVNSGLVVVLILAGGLALYGYRSLQSDIAQLTDARSTAESNAEDLRSQLQQNEQALTAAQARLEHRTSSADKLESELNRLRQTLAEREGQVAELTAQLSQATTNVDTLTRQRDDLTATLTATQSAANAQQTEAQNRIAEFEKQLAEASAALADARREVRQHQSALASETEQRQAVAEQYQRAREQLALQQARSQSATETINDLEAGMAKEKAATDNLQSRLQSLSDEKENLVSRLEDGTTVIKLPESIVFSSGSARIGKAGRHTLTLLADALESFPDHLISIQGHSDSRSIAPALQILYPSNWELSASRAAAAVQVLIDAAIDPGRMQAVGFAATRPLVTEIDAVSRRKNRRIEVLLYPSQFKIKAYRPGGVEPAR